MIDRDIAVPASVRARAEDASALAEADASVFRLGQREGAFDLRPPGEHDRPGIRAAFPPDRGGAGPNPLVRAFGPRIVAVHDLTAGLGGDAYRLARAGLRVHAVERDPVVHALLASAWRVARGVPAEIASRLSFQEAEARAVLEEIDGFDHGVYLDPMYPPPKRASAKPRRELQVLRAWLSPDRDTGPLIEAARARAARVVVKRPHHAAPLVPDPSHTIESKLVRFDVYVNPARLSGGQA
ncbi:MAG: class I SAM-dependent methyltransferase [Myxococcota bacterium]